MTREYWVLLLKLILDMLRGALLLVLTYQVFGLAVMTLVFLVWWEATDLLLYRLPKELRK